MAIAPLQLPSTQPFVGDLGLAQSLSQLGQIYQKGQNQQKLSELGKGLANGTVDYKQAAALTADMGDVTHTLQFLALAEQQKKQGLEKEAAANFSKGLGDLYGANPTPSAPVPNPMPVPGRPTGPIPSVPAGAPVPSSSRVVGDAEGVASGIYDPPAAPGLRPPVQTADASLPPAAMPVQGRLPTAPADAGQPGAQHVPVLLQALSNPNLPATQKETAKILLTEAFKNMKPPEKIQTLRAMQADPSLLEVEKQLRAASKTEVNIDQKGEGELAKTLGKGLGERINDIAKEGDAARTDLAMVGQLRDLGRVVQTGGPAAVQAWLADRGIKVGSNVSEVEAYGSIVDKLTPNQHVPGSGPSSNLDVKMFKSSLPRLINTPGGNEIIENTLAGLAQFKLDRSAIADRVQSGELTAKDGLREMRALPNPYENFKKFAQSGFKADPSSPASAKAPVDTGAAKIVPSTKVEIDQSLANARAAIARNPAIRDAVIQRLRENNIDPSGL